MSTKIDCLFKHMKESLLGFDRQEILEYLHEYACRVAEIEEIDRKRQGHEDFIEFVIETQLVEVANLYMKLGGILIDKGLLREDSYVRLGVGSMEDDIDIYLEKRKKENHIILNL